MRLADLVTYLDTVAPPALAEAWDNVGLLVGDPASDVTRAMLCIDYTAAVAVESRAAGCELVIAYHPPLFKPINRLVAVGGSALLYDAARRGVAIYAPHTALDVAPGGTNDVLADLLGLVDRRPLHPKAATPLVGIGRFGRFERPTPVAELVDTVKRTLGIEHMLVAGPQDIVAESAAVCAGAGGALLDDAIAAGAGVYLTGELRHHDALRAAAAGMTAICTLHSCSERVTLGRLAVRFAREQPGVAWTVSKRDADPFLIM